MKIVFRMEPFAPPPKTRFGGSEKRKIEYLEEVPRVPEEGVL